MATKTKSVDGDYVCMYYEHQYERMGRQEDNRLTITNYVLTMSALAFTFGYQNVTQLAIINGIGLPLIIIIANMFAIFFVERAQEVMKVHQDRAHEVLAIYAPELQEINKKHIWRKGGFLHSMRWLQKGIHVLLILTALIPVAVYVHQII
ncbi:MAG: hypothetical protein WA821_03295 [Anaerolineales bacterium]